MGPSPRRSGTQTDTALAMRRKPTDALQDCGTSRRSRGSTPGSTPRGRPGIADFDGQGGVGRLLGLLLHQLPARDPARRGLGRGLPGGRPGGHRRAHTGVRVRARPGNARLARNGSASPIRSRSTTSTRPGTTSATTRGPPSTSSTPPARSATSASARVTTTTTEALIRQLLTAAHPGWRCRPATTCPTRRRRRPPDAGDLPGRRARRRVRGRAAPLAERHPRTPLTRRQRVRARRHLDRRQRVAHRRRERRHRAQVRRRRRLPGRGRDGTITATVTAGPPPTRSRRPEHLHPRSRGPRREGVDRLALAGLAGVFVHLRVAQSTFTSRLPLTTG